MRIRIAETPERLFISSYWNKIKIALIIFTKINCAACYNLESKNNNICILSFILRKLS
jgi:hypothetical protein